MTSNTANVNFCVVFKISKYDWMFAIFDNYVALHFRPLLLETFFSVLHDFTLLWKAAKIYAKHINKVRVRRFDCNYIHLLLGVTVNIGEAYAVI